MAAWRQGEQEMVVMRRLNLSERRDSFKKQEAVQEVSFDEPGSEDGAKSDTGQGEGCVEPRVGRVPQIAVQGSEGDEQEPVGWQCQGSYPLHLLGTDGTAGVAVPWRDGRRQHRTCGDRASPGLSARDIP